MIDENRIDEGTIYKISGNQKKLILALLEWI